MTEKRFKVGNLKIQDTAPKGRVYLLDMQGGVNALCSLINGLNDKSNRLEKEYEKLKKEYLKLEHRHSLLHDECLDAECERDSLKKDVEYLEKENEQLKQELFETSRDLLWATSDEVDRALHYEDEVEELRKEIFE